jgi:hypothetical protein
MNRSLIEFLEQEYDYIPLRNGNITLSEHELESLLIHMAEDTTNTFVQRAIDRLEPYVGLGILAVEIQAAASETMNYYHGDEV